jgi:hypothetical protein
MTVARTQRSLQVRRSRRGLVLLWVVVIAVVVAFGAWYVTHPAPLPTPDEPLEVSAPLGEAVYVGAYDPAADDDRTLHLGEVSIQVEGEATVAVQVCRDGAVSETTEPETFCSSLDDAANATVEPGDTLVLEIVEDQPGEATVGPAQVSFREGIQWDTQPVGPVVDATFVSR